MTQRLFVAIEIGDGERRALGRIQSRLRRLLPSVRWVKPDTIHLTLRFIGDTEESRVGNAADALACAAAGCAPFDFTLRGVGAFPDARRPHVLWVGVEDPGGSLAALADRLNARLAAAGFPPEDRPFSPHVTIGRLRDRAGGDCGSALSPLHDEPAARARAAGVCLFRSELTPAGPIHTVLYRVPFRG